MIEHATSGHADASLARGPVRPLIKWAGGKSQLLPELLPRLPSAIEYYHEPFAGGLALYFALRPARATVADVNPDLVNFYRQIAIDPIAVHRVASEFAAKHDRDRYYQAREHWNQIRHEDRPVTRAGMFLYLNRACFNGLWRTNRKGEFNVPISDASTVSIPSLDHVLDASLVLATAVIGCDGFEETLEHVGPGDFVYCDPPYVPASATASFTAYGRDGFGQAQQITLESLARQAVERGAMVMLSNSDTPAVRALYADRIWQIDRVDARRAIAASARSRASVGELIIRGGYA